MNTSRRAFLIGSTLAAAGAGSTLTTAAAGGHPLFDLAEPRDNVDAFIKVMGDLSGKPAWISAQGRIYAVRPNEMPLPILAVEGVRYVRFENAGNRYHFHTRDWAFYKDVVTGEPIDEFRNPFTGKTNTTRQILTKYYSWFLGPEGQEVPGYEGEAWLIDRPFVLPWTRDGENVSVPLELLVKYANGSSGGEWMNFTTSASALNDPALASAPANHTWTGYSGWIRWMEMGERPGRTLWQSTGQKHASANDLPPEFRETAERYFPGSLADPENYEKTSYTVSPLDVISKPRQ